MNKKVPKHAPAIIFLGLIILFFKSSASLNFWFWLFVFVQSILLYFLLKFPPPGFLYKKFIFIMLPLVLGIFVLATGVYKDTFKISSFEKNQLWERREMYLRDLGLIGRHTFVNQGIEMTKFNLDKLALKVSQPFDLTRYFFVSQTSIYFLILFPLFIIGLIVLLAEELGIVAYYLGLAVVGSVFVQPNWTFWLFVPFINLGILYGIFNLKKIIKND